MANTTNTAAIDFGPLTGLIGTWQGNQGWNLIAVPNIKVAGKPDAFTLLIQQYKETLTITPLDATTPNRGFATVQEIPTLMYTLEIHDLNTGKLLHAENGTWLLLPDCPSGFTVARQAVVPHGDSVLALGSATTSTTPTFPAINAIPTGQPANAMFGYFDPYNGNSTPPGLNKSNPNATLASQSASQTITQTTTLNVSTNNSGGITNIPFITKNANATQFNSTFWIETVDDGKGGTFPQLQYSQTTILEFFHTATGELIQWPHVNINTLTQA